MKRLAVMMGVWAAVGGAAWGQVVRSQDGRALDANYGVGSGGYNNPSGDLNSISSQYYVTGQVTGLGAFRGTVGYRAADELRLDVPSAGLRTFSQQSVGVSQAVGTMPYTTSAYLDPSSTVLGVRGIQAGLTAPGTNAPIAPILAPPVANRLYQEATEAYKPLLRPAAGRATAVEATGYAPAMPGPAPAAEGAVVSNLPVWKPPVGGIFGVVRPDEAAGLARELQELAEAEEPVEWEQTRGGWLVPPSDAEEPLSEQQRELESSTRGGRVGSMLEAPVEDAGTMEGGPEAMNPPSADATPNAASPWAGRDVYTDLLVGMEQIRQGRSGQQTDAGGDTYQVSESLEEPTARPAGATGELVEVLPNEVVLHALAGKNRDRFNRLMTAGEECLRAGKYYDAADLYELAAVLAPTNPLARVGAGLAYFGAGEPLSAGVEIRRALQLFPPLMETRVDLAGMLARDIVVERLEQYSAGDDEQVDLRAKMVALVCTFMQHNLGDGPEAAEAAGRLKRLAGDDALLSAYAEYVLTGRRPAETPTTQPTEP